MARDPPPDNAMPIFGDGCVQGGDKPGHWSAGELLARAE